MDHKKILILDYSVDRSEADAIARWLPAGTEVSSLFIDTEESFPEGVPTQGFSHVIHSGSSLSITETAPFTEKALRAIRQARDRGVAQMGICYGHQLICLALVGRHSVRSSPNGLEAGWNQVTFTGSAMEHLGVRESERVWQSHFDEVTELPAGSELWATSPHTRIQAYLNRDQRLLGTQFHPEFDREAGNGIYRKDRALLERHGYDVEALIQGGPSFETGKVLFGFFAGF